MCEYVLLAIGNAVGNRGNLTIKGIIDVDGLLRQILTEAVIE